MPQRPISVLVVEDELLIAKLVAEVLSERGFAVHAVVDGEEALRHVESGAAVDVLFTDIELPGRMNGAALAQQVHVRRPELPVVYCSGQYPASAVAVPRSTFLSKPYDPVDLCDLLARVTSRMH